MVNRIKNWLNDDSIPINVRQISILALLVALTQVLVIPVTFIVGVDFYSKTIGPLVSVAAILLLVSGVMVASKNNNILWLRILLAIVTFVALPISFFINGAMHSGLVAWFVIGAFNVINTSTKRVAVRMLAIYCVEVSFCFFFDALNPGLLVHLDPIYWAIDMASSFIFAVICITLFIFWTNNAYEKRGRALEQSLKDLKWEIQEKERIQKEAITDKLTGIPNRTAYAAEANNYDTSGIPDDLWYIGIDINGLKHINDTLGHEAGDEIIIATAHIVRDAVVNYGDVYRLGGDEFVALVRAGEDEFQEILASMNEAMNQWIGKHVTWLSFSVGYVSARELNTEYVADMAKQADGNMYRQKRSFYEEHTDYDRRSR